IQIDDIRIDIPELEESDTEEQIITGGYLMEVDSRLDELSWFTTASQNVPITFKSPEIPNEQQFDYITTYINTFEEGLYNNKFMEPELSYNNYIDVNSLVNWYIVNELRKNNDDIFFSSVYLYKNRNEKLKIGPVWDFDIAIGNVNYNGNNIPEGWWIKNAAW